MAIPCNAHVALRHQGENHEIDERYYWESKGALTWNDVSRLLDSPVSLWLPGYSSYSGINNRVPIDKAAGDSLYLVVVDKLELKVGRKAPEYLDSKRSVRGRFYYKKTYYMMDVTDPAIERYYLAKSDGDYVIMNPALCISLGDPWEGYCYKLIASVLFMERFP